MADEKKSPVDQIKGLARDVVNDPAGTAMKAAGQAKETVDRARAVGGDTAKKAADQAKGVAGPAVSLAKTKTTEAVAMAVSLAASMMPKKPESPEE
jgi:hypothetical protein